MHPLHLAQIIVSSLLILFILLQQRGTALGSIFGGGEFFATRRGAEQKIFWVTSILGALFILLALLNLIR